MKKRIQKFISVLSVLCLLCVQGCAVQTRQVAYSIYPIAYLLQTIGGSTIKTVSIQNDTFVQNATIVDDYEEILNESDVLMHIGELEPYMTVYNSTIKELGTQILDLSSMNAIYDFKRYTSETTSSGTQYIEEEWYDGETFAAIDYYDKDVSLWLDPIAMLSMAKSVKNWLTTNYSENTSLYEQRFVQLETDLINLDAQYQNLATTLSAADTTIAFVSMTPSFGNWQKAYGFEVYPVMLSKYGVLPSEEQIQLIEERILEDQVRYIAYEANMSDELREIYDRIQSDCGLTVVTLSNLSSLTDEQVNEGKDYISIMYENLAVLQQMVPSEETVEEGIE